MNIQQLEYIVALDRAKSFSKAAEACFVTQSTLSTMVKRLEEELELVLFDRKTTPILTTECGKEIVEAAKKVVFHAKQINVIAQQARGHIDGAIKVGIIPTIATSLLNLIIKPLIQKYPELQIEVVEITTESILKELKEGHIDAGIISTPHKYSDDFEEEILYYEKLFVYGNSGSSRQYILPDEIIQERVWLLEEGHCLRDQVLSFCSLKAKNYNDHFQFEANTFETLLSMVDNFGGLTLLPELYLEGLPPERKRKVVEFKPPYPVREVSLVYFRPFAKLRLTEVLAEEIKQLVSPHLATRTLKSSEQIIVQS